jgi:SM-20-related protein
VEVVIAEAPAGGVLLRVLDDAVPAELHAAAWTVCTGARWAFGHRSHDERAPPFWKMDLDGEPAFDAVWAALRPTCEGLVGAPLRVLRQYANGHTYGLGGEPHRDDVRPGTYTLLYVPMPDWKLGWDGETVFFDARGEVARAVRPQPNRAVLFDARIPHVGRPPSRACPALRVTVAFKLEVAGA